MNNQFRLLKGFWYRKDYIEAADYTIVDDPEKGCKYLTALVFGNIPVVRKLTPGLEKKFIEMGLLQGKALNSYNIKDIGE